MTDHVVAGLLLTGGRSSRMGPGRDKAALFAPLLAARLAAVVPQAYECGPGWTALPQAGREDPGVGPLGALAAAALELPSADVVVLACDMPFVTEELLRHLAEPQWSGRTVVPMADGHAQTLCARYSAADVARAPGLVAAGERSMRALLDTSADAVWLDGLTAGSNDFADVDTPEDLARLGWGRA